MVPWKYRFDFFPLLKTINELKELAGDDADDEDGDEAAMLSEEAKMPIEELLDRMKQVRNLMFVLCSFSECFCKLSKQCRNYFCQCFSTSLQKGT